MKDIMIGLPGLLTKDENGRLELIASQFPEMEYHRVAYVDATKNENEISIDFSLIKSVERLKEKLRYIDKRKKISFLTSSTGASVMAYTLAEMNIPIENYVAISPLYRLGKNAREQLVKVYGTNVKIDVGSLEDRKKGNKRILTSESLKDFLSIDCNNLKKPKVKNALTLIGRKDERASIEDSIDYHLSIGGNQKNIIYFECGHDIPYCGSNERIIEFLKEFKQQQNQLSL